MPIILKVCCHCKQEKYVWKFYKNYNRRDGRHTVCIECGKVLVDEWRKNNSEKILEYNRKTRRKHRKEGNVRYLIMKRLSSSRELAKRGGYKCCSATIDELVPLFTTTCQMCEEYVGMSIHLDHCHVTGRFRGFICRSCNSIIGYAQDSIPRLKRAIEYLKNRE